MRRPLRALLPLAALCLPACAAKRGGAGASVERPEPRPAPTAAAARPWSIGAPGSTFDGLAPSAAWIWAGGAPNPKNTYVHFRKRIQLAEAPRRAVAYVSASSVADLYVNGRLVDRVPVNADPAFQTYDRIDLAPYLRAGENVVAALVHSFGAGMHHHIDAPAGLFVQARVEGRGGLVARIETDASWRALVSPAWDPAAPLRSPGPRLIGHRERFDARRAPEGWTGPAFDDGAWEAATPIGVPPRDPWRSIVVTHRPRLHRERVAPASTRRAGRLVVADFGREIVAHPIVRVRGPEGREVELATAERLRPDGTPDATHALDYRDVYVTRDGAQSFQPFTWRSFRYLGVTLPDDVTLDEVAAEVRGFAAEHRGAFAASDPQLGELWRIGRYTTWLCMQDTLVDTAWREQTQYIGGDSRYDLRYIHAAFSPAAEILVRYNLLSGAFSQRFSPEGAIRGRSPTGWLLGPRTSTYIPDYQLDWVLMLWEHHLHYGDLDLPRLLAPNLDKLLAYFDGHVGPSGLLGEVHGWTVLDHPDTFPMDVRGESTAMNALYVGALEAAARLARGPIGDEARARRWQARAAQLRAAVNARLWDEARGAYRDGGASDRVTQQTQVYALLHGVVPAERRERVIAFVKAQGRSTEQALSYWLLAALFDAGEDRWALEYLRTHWGAQTRRPDWNGAFQEAWAWPEGSTAHAWTSGPTALLTEKVLGIEPVAPGWARFRVRPRPADLAWAEGRVATVRGEIPVRWRREATNADGRARLRVELTVPPRTTAEIVPPAAGAAPIPLGPGAHAVSVEVR